MSVRPTTGRDMERLLAQLNRRVTALERLSSLRVGDNWRVEEADSGDLVVTYVPTGAVTVIASP